MPPDLERADFCEPPGGGALSHLGSPGRHSSPQEHREGLRAKAQEAISRLVPALDEHLCFLLDDTRPSHELTSFDRPV